MPPREKEPGGGMRDAVQAGRCAYATDYTETVTYFEDLILFFHGKDDCSDRTNGEEERPRVRLNGITHAELALEPEGYDTGGGDSGGGDCDGRCDYKGGSGSGGGGGDSK